MTQDPNLTPTEDDEMAQEAIRAWRELFSSTSLTIREAVASVVNQGAEALTEDFYTRMLEHPRAASFLDQERVQKRLRASMRRWMRELFATLQPEQIPQAIDRQIEVGTVHARIRLPIDLIPSGIRLLKRGIRRRIAFTTLDADERLIAQIYVSDLLHLADGLMNQAYFRDTQQVVRNDEAYRQLSHKRSLAFERTRQRAALSEWAEALLIATWSRDMRPSPLRDSEFGIWLHHKGAVLFERCAEFEAICDAVEVMDTQLLPRLAQARADRVLSDAAVNTIKQLLDLIRHKLNDLFDSSQQQDDGVDEETRLPDQRYLPAILAREMRAHQQSGRPFCLVMIEIQFPALKSQGHGGARQRLLQASAQAVVETSRTTDHVFRYDEHRFLLVAVECDLGKANDIAAALAEKLGHTVNTGNVHGLWTPITPSVSIGIAEYDRHPDYQYFIQRAEAALAEAVTTRRGRIAAS